MKKNLFKIATVALLAAVACNKELPVEQVPADSVVSFEASVDGADTKVALDGKVSKWESGDVITLHNGTTGYAFSTTDAGTKAIFSYDGNDFTGEKFMAVYPSGNYTADVEAKTVTAAIPTYQPSRENNFSVGAVPSVAYTETQSLAFKNVASLLKFTVKGTNVKGLVFYGHNNEAVSGNVLVSLNDDNTIKSVTAQETTITENDVTETKFVTWAKVWAQTDDYCFNEGVTYYLAVVPQNFEKGFSVQLEIDGVGTKDVKKLETAYELKPNTIVDLGELEYVAAPVTELVWGVCGTMTNWADGSDLTMTLEGDWYVAKEVTLTSGDKFKFRANGSWDENRGLEEDGAVAESAEVKVCKDGKDIAVASSAVYDLYLSKDASLMKAVKVGDIEADVDATAYGLVGSFQAPTTWDVANPVAMEYVSDGWIVVKNIELYKSDEFKFVKDKSWTISYGTSAVTVLEENKETTVVTANSQNMKVSKNGKYDLYLNPNELKVKAVCVEEYTDLQVNITIDNKANWSPLTISLWDGDTQIVTNATVTDNKYPISGEYIGSTLTCQLSSGSKTSEKMSVAVTKTGATVTLEETVIKLKFQLNTSNAKQWWGSTTKIHVWNTGTSFDTSWPGNTMTSEGNYTWSIIVPSELVGKTINFLVHNGNGWQSKDSKVTISAEGNTVTGSSIGVN